MCVETSQLLSLRPKPPLAFRVLSVARALIKMTERPPLEICKWLHDLGLEESREVEKSWKRCQQQEDVQFSAGFEHIGHQLPRCPCGNRFFAATGEPPKPFRVDAFCIAEPIHSCEDEVH